MNSLREMIRAFGPRALFCRNAFLNLLSYHYSVTGSPDIIELINDIEYIFVLAHALNSICC